MGPIRPASVAWTYDSRMPIPELGSEGFLPPGIHDAQLEEVGVAFGRFLRSDRRVRLFHRFCEYLAELRRLGHAVEVLLDGSFVTSKAEPEDIDMIVVYPRDFSFGANLVPAEYNMIDRRRVRRVFGFDVAPVTAHSRDLDIWLEYFCQDLRRRIPNKGLIRVIL